MVNTYEIKPQGDQFVVVMNGRVIILSATRQPMTFASIEAAQSFVTINRDADYRHGR